MSYDPTRIEIAFDPRNEIMRGIATHGYTPFECPYVSQITDSLYVGGCHPSMTVPAVIDRVVSLYQWERYRDHPGLKSHESFEMYDSDDLPDVDTLNSVVDVVVNYLNSGDTVLVHCQAGLNRSNLISALVLMRQGHTARSAIELLREKRSPAVLCNRTFERFLLSLDPSSE